MLINEKCKASIITVCFNSEKTIERTIKSVLNQTSHDFEYVIIDGKSTDATLEIINGYKELFEKNHINLRIISEKDNGMYDAMNKGILLARGEIIGIINSDDWFEPIAVETAIQTFEETNCDLFFADLRIIRKNGKKILKKARLRKFATTRNWNHPTSFVAKRTYEELGLFSLHSMYDDWDFYLRVKKENKKIVIKNIVLANFVFGGVSNKKTLKDAITRCKYKYWCYRNNNFSRLYWFECFVMEIAKFFLS